jgi:O-antigen ligase
LVLLLSALWLAGGASRADVLGQVIVRGIAWFVLVIIALTGERLALGHLRVPMLLLGLAVVLPLLQLVPLPVSVWQSLPGRGVLIEAAAASGQAQPWRPWSMVPAATLNALGSLVIPLAALMLMAGLREQERCRLPALLLGFIVAGTMVGLLQASGAGFGNALINGTAGDVSGTFANRNHFALLVAIGCLLVPAWAFGGGRRPGWRPPVALGLMLLFVLTILATGSRAGLAVGALAVMLALLLARQGLRRELRLAPPWMLPIAVAAIVAVLALLVAISITADRAQSVNRLMAIDAAQDTRLRALPTVLFMVGKYFPVGTGFGSFDPLFRINEPYHLLKPTYFNHAHNDFLEVMLDGGVPALALLLAALGWWAAASVRAWRAPLPGALIPRTGSATLLLIAIASIFDYPARTPMMMAVVVIAAAWLAERIPNRVAADVKEGRGPARRHSGGALPVSGQHL